jgi:hypothetical protein
MNEENYLASFKYSGEKVSEGYFDIRKSVEILLGIDELIRFYLYRKSPELLTHDFELPVRIKKGSWEVLIPENIGDIIRNFLIVGGSAYVYTALKKLAENDVGDKGFKDLFKFIIKSIKWSLLISKHLGTNKKRQFEKIKVQDRGNLQYIGISNEKGIILYVPKDYLDFYSELPANIFNKLLKYVEKERVFEVDFSPQEKGDPDDLETKMIITENEKNIFVDEEDSDEILFPELVHGQYVELEGYVTRGNESSNTIGFKYKEHILTCTPQKGNIKLYKTHLFSNCIIRGFIDRKDKEGKFIEKRPRINYEELVLVKKEDTEKKLF